MRKILLIIGVLVVVLTAVPQTRAMAPGTVADEANRAWDRTAARTIETQFSIYWPPRDPEAGTSSTDRPLLHGRLITRWSGMGNVPTALRIAIQLERPHDEASRQFWNSRLAFPEYAWMEAVRVWDARHQWLWPNLPYLLRLPGVERVERYGGVDPGKGVDNDFAAVLIRKYDARGGKENFETKRRPLVSAEWHPADVKGTVDKHTIVHAARSDVFTVHLQDRQGARAGQLRLWLIYADFFGARPPATWPRTPEFAGGILVYFQVNWQLDADGGCQLDVRQMTPPSATGFNWDRWATRIRLRQPRGGGAVLSDGMKQAHGP